MVGIEDLLFGRIVDLKDHVTMVERYMELDTSIFDLPPDPFDPGKIF